MFKYWSCPPIIQKMIAAAIPKKSHWEIEATKTTMGDWIFDIFPFIKDEALCGGTEFIIDTYYIHIKGQPASPGDTIKMSISADKPKKYDACCTNFESCDGFGHTYTDIQTQMNGWFCPMFENMFGQDIPKQIYVKFS